MRKVAHPVVAITVSNLPQTSEPTASTDAGEGTSPSLQAGMLASSFNTVSLDPDPIVSFNVRLPSRTYDAIVQTGKFEVSPIWNIHAAKAFESRQNNRNKMLPYLDRLTNGRLFGLKCEWLEQKSIEVADHVIIIGKVIEVVGMPENKSPLGALVYSDGQYRFATDSVVETLDRMKEEQIEQRARRKEEEKESRGRRREQRREEQLKREEEKDERLARLRDEKREREREEKQKAKEERLQMRERKREEKERLDLLITSL
ncbi:hypothetical protein MMC10_010491 [Thelotrema lepadinum]|nr:hypothetical protein [Thelotrema lepadinum]